MMMQGGGMMGCGGNCGRPGDWICPTCGDLQFAFRKECNMCGAEKPAGASGGGSRYSAPVNVKPGDWNCGKCGDLVYSKKDSCRCGYTKTEHIAAGGKLLGMKEGDSICPSCGGVVFAFRDACNLCGTPKAAG